MVRIARASISVAASAILCALALVSTSGSVSLAAGTDAVSLDVGDYHSCVARADGTAWCWGYAGSGEIGDGGTGDPTYHLRSSPTQVQSRSGGPLTGVKSVTVGGSASCALKRAGTVVCWGSDYYAQLGDGTTGNADHVRLLPVAVKHGAGLLDNVRSVSIGWDHACAVRNDGSVWCWGDAEYGQVGDGTNGDPTTHLRLDPVRVRQGAGFLQNAIAVTSGNSHACALTEGGLVWCWGKANFGQIGDGSTGDPTTHLRLKATRALHANEPLSKITQLVATGDHTCARASDGSAWCWGDAARGQLGDGTTGLPTKHIRVQAVRVRNTTGPLPNVVSVGAGIRHSCARLANDTAWCWGANDYGQVGDGTTGDPTSHNRVVAHQVMRPSSALTGVRSVAGGVVHSCALGPAGSVWCWGWNGNGQLGRGTHDTDLHLFAVKVLFP